MKRCREPRPQPDPAPASADGHRDRDFPGPNRDLELAEAQRLARVGSWHWDAATDATVCSDETFRIFGLDPSAQRQPLTREEWGHLFPPGSWRRIDEALRNTLRTGADYSLEVEAFRGSDWIWIATRGETVLDRDGRVVGLRGVVQDITERRRAEEELLKIRYELEMRVGERTASLQQAIDLAETEQRRFQEVLDLMPAYLLLLTPDYHVQFANRYFEERYGKSEGRCCFEYLFNRAEPCETCETYKVLKTNLPLRWEWTAPDGRVYDIHDFPFTDLDGSPLIMEVGLDITDRKRDEISLTERSAEVQRLANHLRALAVELSQAEQRERKRLSMILHDHIQQLLVAARMQLEWLKNDDYPERRQAAAQGIDGILRQALEASRSLTVDLSPPVLHEAGLVGGLNWLAARMRDKHQFTVHLQADNKAEPVTEETRFLLFECARELLFNALKHAGIREAEVQLLRTGDDRIQLLVRDGGAGFDPDTLGKRRADEVSFGLFSIQQRLAHLGGDMVIETAPGKGASITLSVPIVAEKPRMTEAGAAPPAPASADTARPRADTRRVIIVDDHRIMREGLVGLLRLEPDIEVVGEASDGPQAVALAARLRPDAVIMDVNLGDMSGVEATRAILAANPAIKVIGLSMHVDPAISVAMREAGATAYLTKGGPSEDLTSAIRACCA